MPDKPTPLVSPATSAISNLIDDYLAHCRASGLSPKTVGYTYRYPLREVLFPFCSKNQIIEPEQLTNRVMNRLSNQLHEEGGATGKLSPHTIHSYIRSINGFLSWAKKEGEGIEAKAALPVLPKRILEVLS
ncbi:MAG: hypothetical protein ACREP9_03245, partial [Candidatus Dormibacteraceae bacterium]